jgi:thiol-disulfide isomerase/thioredoxin
MTVAVPVPSVGAMRAVAATPAPARVDRSNAVDPVGTICGHADLLAALEKSATGLVVVQVKAKWCRSCKALEPKVRRLAREFGVAGVSFYQMDYEAEENKPLCYQLNVTSMPTFLMYAGASGKIDQFTCGPARASILREKIEDVVAGECAYDPYAAVDSAPPIASKLI